MAKFIDSMTDTGFKIVFGKEGQSNEILMALLNELFRGQEGFEPIVSLKYINNERSRDNDEGKTIIHDIICETQLGHKFMVEMHKQPQPFFQDWAEYYMSRALTEQARLSDWNFDRIIFY